MCAPGRGHRSHPTRNGAGETIDRLVHDQQDDPVMHNTTVVDAQRSRILSDVAAADIDTAATGVLVHDSPAFESTL